MSAYTSINNGFKLVMEALTPKGQPFSIKSKTSRRFNKTLRFLREPKRPNMNIKHYDATSLPAQRATLKKPERKKVPRTGVSKPSLLRRATSAVRSGLSAIRSKMMGSER